MKREPKRAHKAGGKVFWTDMEKAQVIAKAVETQAEHPDLAGLPLLRAAMSVLPVGRRRKLIALSQADWFEPGLTLAYRLRDHQEEARTRRDVVKVVQAKPITIDHDQATDPYLPHFREIVRTTKELAENPVKACIVDHESDPYLPVLKQIAEEAGRNNAAAREMNESIFARNAETLSMILLELQKQTEVITRLFGNGPPSEVDARAKGEPPQSYDAPPETKVNGYAGRRMINFMALAAKHGYDFDS